MGHRLFRGLYAGRFGRLSLPAILVAAALAVAALGGCGADTDTTTSTSATASTVSTTTTVMPTTTTAAPETTTTSAASTTTTEALSSAEILLPNGNIKGMGYIDKVWESGGVRHISIDYAQMLTGEEARQAGRLVDATQGRRTRSIIVTDSGHVILSAVQTETMAQRLEQTSFEDQPLSLAPAEPEVEP